jgi:hypothetical protein
VLGFSAACLHDRKAVKARDHHVLRCPDPHREALGHLMGRACALGGPFHEPLHRAHIKRCPCLTWRALRQAFRISETQNSLTPSLMLFKQEMLRHSFAADGLPRDILMSPALEGPNVGFNVYPVS